jgi:arylsulfatase A-like enzyme
VLSKEKGPKGAIPANVLLPYPIGQLGGNLPHGDTAGFLGKKYDPFVLNADPADPHFHVPDMLPPDYIAALRVDRRRDWRRLIDNSVSYFESSQDAKLMDSTFSEAYTLMTSSKARAAFDLNQEPEDVRKRYGMNRFGQGCLLARRLIESGVRFVTVNMFETVFNEITWDIHGSAPFSPISAMNSLVGPMFDNAFSSLIEDLSDRGLLDNTLVLATGEFGRTPRINPAGGRDHWPQCWSIVMAGGGIKGGQVVGSSDSIGAAPKDRPVQPSHVAATVYHALGIPIDLILSTPEGRQVRLVDHGFDPIMELFS